MPLGSQTKTQQRCYSLAFTYFGALCRQSVLNSTSSTGHCGFWRRREVCSVDNPLATPQLSATPSVALFESQNHGLVTVSLAHVRARHSAAWYVADNRHCRA